MERDIKTYLRGESVFSSPKLYKTCEMNGCFYAIRLKQNATLVANAHVHLYCTNMDMKPYQIIQFYCGRGMMEIS